MGDRVVFLYGIHGSEDYSLNVTAADSAGGAIAEELNEHATSALTDVFGLFDAAVYRCCGNSERLGEGELCVADGDGCWGVHGVLLFVGLANVGQ